jgi:hypothetical protein
VAAVAAASVNWSVAIDLSGRDGTVTYREGPETLSLYWEMGGTALAIVSGPPPQDWDRAVPWASGRREEVMRRVADEVIRQSLRRAVATFGDDYSTIVFTRRARSR